MVAFDVVAGKGDGETVEDVDYSALQIVLGREAVVRIIPRSMHCEVDAIDESFVVTVEKMVDVVRDLDVEVAKVVVQEEHE